MVITYNVLKEVHLSENIDVYTEFSPIGKYKFLFDDYIFRGESNTYKLLPSALREDKYSFNKLFNFAGFNTSSDGINFEHPQRNFEYFYQMAELRAIKRFYDLADQKGLNLPDVPFLRKEILNPSSFVFNVRKELGDVWIPDDLLEIAALAQHYGVPTRLIDWTSNIYTSLYFASIGVIKNRLCNGDMVLYALNYRMIEFLKNSTSKIPLRLIRPAHYRNPNSSYQKGILSCWSYSHFDIIDSLDVVGENSNIKMPLIDTSSLDVLMQDYVNKNNITWGSADGSMEDPLIYKFYIPHSKAYEIYDLVTKLGYGADNLFTGFDGIVKRMEEDTIYNREKNNIKSF
ncbi:FRG domain-containing protein [Bacillus cereus]|uniref:FRG domain-containing protein n=1 Tax=Bacillus cereus TaxID=1396 RepID=UPI00356CAF73